MRMRSSSWALGAVLLLANASPASAQLWRNGIFDGFSALASARVGAGFDARVYDNFVVSGTGWQITSLYGEFLTDFTPEVAYWEIRSGITKGLGGTLLHSATSSVTSFTDLGDAFELPHLGVTVGGFGPFNLGPGEYWLTIALVTDQGQAYLATTDGTNGVNALTDFKFFYDAPAFGATFDDEPVVFDAFSDFALGVDGSLSDSVVPEPSTVVLMSTGLGLIALAGWRRRRRTG